MAATGPSDLIRYPGLSAEFSTLASGTGPLHYQWRKDGVDIAGATNATYQIESVNAADAAAYCVVVKGACASVTNCATLTVLECLPLTSDTPRLNLQSGLFEQKVRVSNPTDLTFSAVRVSIYDLTDGAQVYNASGDTDGVPLVKFNQPLGPGEVVDLTIEYYVASRQMPQSRLCAQPALSTSPIQQDGTPVNIDRIMRLADGTMLIEFEAVQGQVYQIQYCEELGIWKTATPNVTSESNRIQWIDNGQPKTDGLPDHRMYRVITAPE